MSGLECRDISNVIPNISGNFSTRDKEIAVTADFLKKHGLKESQFRLEKFGESQDGAILTNAISAGDVLAKYAYGQSALFEIKEEKIKRFNKYHQLGFDFLSVFHFKKDTDSKKWRGLHQPSEIRALWQSIDFFDPSFKGGKMDYSRADCWLFFVKNDDGSYAFLKGYDARKFDRKFWQYIINKYPFAVNCKTGEQLSHTDSWESAVIYVDADDCKLAECEIPYNMVPVHGFLKVPGSGTYFIRN